MRRGNGKICVLRVMKYTRYFRLNLLRKNLLLQICNYLKR